MVSCSSKRVYLARGSVANVNVLHMFVQLR
jgi:hypothetical protein